MNRKGILAAVVLVVLAVGIYFAWSSFESIWSVVMTAKDLVAPADKPAPALASTSAPTTSSAPVALTGFAAKFKDQLLVMDGNSPRNLDTHKLAGVKYWAFYYSASWCPPCQGFTPELVSFYRQFKPSHPDFELIFVSDDKSDADMINYMVSDNMPWPAVWYDQSKNPDLGARKYAGEGIPCLVLVDADGTVLADTYKSGEYTDPRGVVQEIEKIVK